MAKNHNIKLKLFTNRFLSHYFIRHIVLVLFAVLSLSCSTSLLQSLNNTQVTVKGVLFKNNSNLVINSIKLKVDETGRYINCSGIQRGSTCSTTFPLRKYQNNALTIQWWQQGISYTRESFKIETSELKIEPQQYILIITINSNGKISAQFIPDNHN